jgi:hypothetical protein
MILEIAGRRPEVVPVQYTATAREPRIDCLIGEKMWREWRERYDEW